MTRVSITRKINVRDPNVLPAWVPAEGTFANISTNTLFQAKPTGWPNSDVAGPFNNWSGGIFAPDFGVSGGYVVHGSGHLTQGTPTWAGVWVFDLDSLQWVGRNVPSEPLLENSTLYNIYGESLDVDTTGHTYPPHTYDGLVYQPAANGGGTSGSLIKVGMPGYGGSGAMCVHQFDLSSTTNPATRVVDTLASISTSYPSAAHDEARGGFWVMNNNGAGVLGFVSYADWSETTYSITTTGPRDIALIYSPDRDCLIAIRRLAESISQVGVAVCPIVNDAPQGWVSVSPIGTAPADSRCGGVWSSILGCVVSYQGVPAGSSDLSAGYIVHKLILPSDLINGTWQWLTETLTGAGGATPTIGKDSNNNNFTNGTWSRFVEVPSARCFLFAASVNGPVQAWRLTGM